MCVDLNSIQHMSLLYSQPTGPPKACAPVVPHTQTPQSLRTYSFRVQRGGGDADVLPAFVDDGIDRFDCFVKGREELTDLVRALFVEFLHILYKHVKSKTKEFHFCY